jgi:WD40 repeat protein
MATLNNLDGGGSLQNLNGIHKVSLNGSLYSKGNFLGSKNGLHASRTFQLSSQQNLLKKKQIEKENAAVYKLKRQLEGEETDRAIESSGCVEWSWSKRQDSEIHTLKFTPDNNYIAVGCGDGQISIYHLPTQNRLFALNPDMKMNLPCTSICFRPENEDLDQINKNIFAASCNTKLTKMRMVQFAIGI